MTPVIPVQCSTNWAIKPYLLRVLRFSSLHKNHSKFQFDQNRQPARKPAKADVASSLDIVIYIIYLFFLLLLFGSTAVRRRWITIRGDKWHTPNEDLVFSNLHGYLVPVKPAKSAILYVDDTESFMQDPMMLVLLNSLLTMILIKVSVWLRRNGLISNHKKSDAMLVGSRYSVANTCRRKAVETKWTLQIFSCIYGQRCPNWNKHITRYCIQSWSQTQNVKQDRALS